MDADGLTVHFSGTSVKLPAPKNLDGKPTEIGLRPDYFELDADNPSLTPQVEVVEQLGDTTLLYTRLPDGQQATVQLPGQIKATPGDQVPLRIVCKSPLIFDEGGANLFA